MEGVGGESEVWEVVVEGVEAHGEVDLLVDLDADFWGKVEERKCVLGCLLGVDKMILP